MHCRSDVVTHGICVWRRAEFQRRFMADHFYINAVARILEKLQLDV
jgi:hypothetical protein